MKSLFQRDFTVVVAMFALLVATSCFKDEEYDSNLIFKNGVFLNSGDETSTPLSGVEIYAYAPFVTLIADKSDEAYEVLSYDDAVAGIITHSVTGESRSYDATAVAAPFSSSYAGYEDALSLKASGERIFIIAIDTENKGFAYNNYSVGLNLSDTYIALNWLAWRSGFYTQGKWNFYSTAATKQ